MKNLDLSKEVIKIKFKENKHLLGMTEGFDLSLENVESVSTSKVNCRYPRMGSYGTKDGLEFYFMEDNNKAVTLNLKNHKYNKVILEVNNKEKIAKMINKSIQK